MNPSRYRANVYALANHAAAMTVEGLQDAILEDWKNPQWPAMLFDGMNLALRRKMGRNAYAQWFDSLPMEDVE